MHGLVLVELKKHVELTYGPATWEALLLAAGLPGQTYAPLGEYDDTEVMALASAASDATGQDLAAVLEGFGRFLAPGLVETYRFLLPDEWDALDVVEHTELALHAVVRASDGASPPYLEVVRATPDRLSLRYASRRRLCALARGIVLGLGDYYGTPLQVAEPTCVHRGAAHCHLTVARAPLVPAPRDAHEQATSPVR